MPLDMTNTWVPSATDVAQRGSLKPMGTDPERPWTSRERRTGVPATSGRLSERRTLFCRDGAHQDCQKSGGSIASFDFQFRRPVHDPCNCRCHTERVARRIGTTA